MCEKQAKYMKLYKYARICWASYSTGLNDGMFGKEGFGYVDSEMSKQRISKKQFLPTYFQALTQSSMLVFDAYNISFDEDNANEFVNRYEVLAFTQDNDTGFSATLFYDKEKDKFVVGFRGTETDIDEIEEILMDLVQDIALSLDGNLQSSALLDFLKQVDKIIKNENKNIVFVGHSLGGYLAQMAFIYCDKKHKDKLSFSPSEVYTFNAPSIYG
ncbi:hypothetical protein CHELV3228_0694 [Campylobacter helveticus]|uniref:Mbeg1-like protein n=3 Tax=Campylobacter helveticus TaxID=28898 RepID=UPI0009C35E49|nr:Mbeg1-like protein [Campylobacter helveticus]ARE80304.1 hypothetical protein CHELV3228_0694 [Campylobacter helveticus]MCR2055701.1 DUF2974 domain-containing protein [Campylobacter helveticus]SUW83007.1 methyltransferase small [Campylobacter helveticus]